MLVAAKACMTKADIEARPPAFMSRKDDGVGGSGWPGSFYRMRGQAEGAPLGATVWRV
jgi:hypothetical protein